MIFKRRLLKDQIIDISLCHAFAPDSFPDVFPNCFPTSIKHRDDNLPYDLFFLFLFYPSVVICLQMLLHLRPGVELATLARGLWSSGALVLAVIACLARRLVLVEDCVD